MTYDCMTPDELALWQESARAFIKQRGWGGKTPCVDCPAAFRLAEIEAGRCDRLPPVETMPDVLERKREWMRAYRARMAS